MTDVQKLWDMACAAGRAEQVEAGQQTLGYLVDVLALLDPAMPIEWDTGHQFGNDPVEWDREDAFSYGGYSQPAHDNAHSMSAFPSSYRGYYEQCCFNCSLSFDRSTVGHVLAMARDAIGRSFSGYKGGVYNFDRGTLVWGGHSSHGSTSDSAFVGVEVREGVVVLLTGEDD